jgi:hypothetical protein
MLERALDANRNSDFEFARHLAKAIARGGELRTQWNKALR